MIDEASGCWIWQRQINAQGYGTAIRFNGVRSETIKAHRLIYERERGEIPEEALHHLCGNKACVNPDHLEPITHSDHAKRHGLGGPVRR